MPKPSHSLADDLATLGELEQRIIHHFVHRKPIHKNLNTEYDEGMTFGQRMADRVATLGGSWKFIGVFMALMILWIIANTLTGRAFDPYPFILLNLVLSCLAALQAPVIMMSQNRLAAKDRLDAQNDYEVNMKAEMEIVALHLKLDELRDKQWTQLVEMQTRQIQLLETLATK
jgi:uncharacterized membrane protein